MGAYDRLQPGLFIMRQGDRESKWHGHGPAPEYKGETAIHAMTMPPFYIVAQLKYTGTGFTKQTSRLIHDLEKQTRWSSRGKHGNEGFHDILQRLTLGKS